MVRAAALQELETANSTQQVKPLAKRERDTLLVIIAALAKIAKIDVDTPSSAASAIESETERMGARLRPHNPQPPKAYTGCPGGQKRGRGRGLNASAIADFPSAIAPISVWDVLMSHNRT